MWESEDANRRYKTCVFELFQHVRFSDGKVEHTEDKIIIRSLAGVLLLCCKTRGLLSSVLVAAKFIDSGTEFL